ncbi:nitrite reductase [Haloferula helveola]|uniref:Nitrite reductase n=1 Tax=Haloferula helveola TaxID=490095 RepID=A0ABN6H0P4_9BACT|nr:nitrite reductase [Haloferula helveola]
MRFCEEAVALRLNRKFRITVIGGEPRPAYDRVRLSRYVKGRDEASLTIRDSEWYSAQDIELKLGDPVSKLDRSRGCVVTESGVEVAYDELVLATGSAAFVPPLEGVGLQKVFVYRTIDDLEAIMSAAGEASKAVVIGGGLLGLEAAQALETLGLKVAIVERAAFPMPRQLNAKAGALVTGKLESLGLGFHGSFAGQAIRRTAEGLELVPEDGAALTCDLIVISAGIAPNSELAAAAELECGVRGGVVVDHQLATSDPKVHAIGECALHEGQIYGLAAPAVSMAHHVARKLAGKRPPDFERPDLSTRLKMLGIDVVTIGDPLDRGETVEFEGDGIYRAITLDPRRVPVGALGIGEWPESSQIHGWYREGRALRDKEVARFAAEGVIDAGAASASVLAWPGERMVCNCMSVTKDGLCRAIACGAASPEKLAEATGASTVCGSCAPLLAELCGSPAAPGRAMSPLLLIAIALLALVAAVLVPVAEVPVATSVESFNYALDRFWSDALPKQITGYSLLGVSLLGLLISLRKRLPRFRFGAFAKWRVFHAAFGLVALGALFAHTGFRFGDNLNACLMAVFVGLNLLGAVAGVAAGLETRGGPRAASLARRLRPGLTVAHYVFFWPLPVLVAFHIAAAYIY